MEFFTTIRRVVEATLTAFGVVFGLVPDPTAQPVPVRIYDEYAEGR